MLANIKKTALAAAVIAAATSVSAPAFARSELTIVPDFYPTMVRNFNPYLATNLRTTTDFIYEPLVVFNEMHGNTPVMRLAESYKMSDDLMSVTFDIRKGVKWSDGQAFTANDVLYSFNLLKNKPELDQRGINKWVTSVEKIDDYKVRFRLTEANSNVPYEISQVPIVAEHVWKEVKDPTTFTNENPVGTGPFTEIDTLLRNFTFSAATRITGTQQTWKSTVCVFLKSPTTTNYWVKLSTLSSTGHHHSFRISTALTQQRTRITTTGTQRRAHRHS